MDYFQIAYTVLGGLGVFFFGMKNMSDSLQAMGGGMIKKIIGSLTSNRFMAVGVGAFVTMMIQSSSITTVMMVGFVNAGLMNLTQALGVVFGANIGTTITGWIISIKVSKYGLLLVGLGVFPFLFSKNDSVKRIGQLVFALGFIFFGLTIMSGAFKPLRSDPGFISNLALFVEPTYVSFIASAGIGCLLTMVIQSSSAMLGITIAMATTGIIPFSTAAALVLGENIGTTITAQLASIGGSLNARRAARGHACFNLLGVVLVLAVFPIYLEFIEWLVPGLANFSNAAGEKPNIAIHIATSHTVFNIIATVSFLPFLNPLVRFVEFIVPDRSKVAKQPEERLKVLGGNQYQIPDLSLLEAKKYIMRLKGVVDTMFLSVGDYLYATEKQDTELLNKEIFKKEDITDEYTKEVNFFLEKVMEHDLTIKQSIETQSFLSVTEDLETIGDYIKKLAVSATKYKENYYFEDSLRDDFLELFEDIREFYSDIMCSFENIDSINIVSKRKYSLSLLAKAEQLRESHADILVSEKVDFHSMLSYSDMVNTMRRVRSHTFSICLAVKRLGKDKDV
jgi:phosphate:Na+ symporter